MTKIYSKYGDSGLSRLLDRSGLSKSEKIFELLGGIDELSAILGVIISFEKDSSIIDKLRDRQTELYYLSAELAGANVETIGKNLVSSHIRIAKSKAI